MAKTKRRLSGLSEHSIFYKENAAIYEDFSKAEDVPERILICLSLLKRAISLRRNE